MLVEPLSDIISDNIIFPLMEKALGRDFPSAAEIRHQQPGEQVRSSRDAAVKAPSQAPVEASVPPLNAIDDAERVIKDSAPLEAIAEGVDESHSLAPSPENDEGNRESLIRRAALGGHPTKEEMDAVLTYGLEQNRINFPYF